MAKNENSTPAKTDDKGSTTQATTPPPAESKQPEAVVSSGDLSLPTGTESPAAGGDVDQVKGSTAAGEAIPQFATLEQLTALQEKVAAVTGNAGEVRQELEDDAPTYTHTVYAVAVPNGRRMRGGCVFSKDGTDVHQAEFSAKEWEAIEDDQHLKVKPFRGQ